jgi:uncharacterized protein YqeY
MTLDILQKEMIAAMKEHNKLRKDTISSLVGAIKKVAIDEKCKDNITEELVNKVLLKEKKTMQEMIDTCPENRTDLLEDYTARMAIINEFVPKMMSEDEVRQAVYHILSTVDIQQDNKGAVMKAVVPRLKGKADMAIVNKVVSSILK